MIHIIGLGDVQLVNRQNREQFVRDDNTDERNTLILCEISLGLLVAKDLFPKFLFISFCKVGSYGKTQ